MIPQGLKCASPSHLPRPGNGAHIIDDDFLCLVMRGQHCGVHDVLGGHHGHGNVETHGVCRTGAGVGVQHNDCDAYDGDDGRAGNSGDGDHADATNQNPNEWKHPLGEDGENGLSHDLGPLPTQKKVHLALGTQDKWPGQFVPEPPVVYEARLCAPIHQRSNRKSSSHTSCRNESHPPRLRY